MTSMAASSSLTVAQQYDVFLNFRGEDIRNGFVSHLVDAFQRSYIDVFIDKFEERGKHLDTLLERIEAAKVALAVFSENYTDSNWCLKELEKMYDCMKGGNLVVVPIFYKVEPSTVGNLKGDFGDKLWTLAKGDDKKKKWDDVFNSISNLSGIIVDKTSNEDQKVKEIVKAVKTILLGISSMGNMNVSVDPSGHTDAGSSSGPKKHKTFGNKQRLKELEEKLDITDERTRTIAVVGMPGIGKTTLLQELFTEWQPKFKRNAFLHQIRVKSKDPELDPLPQVLLNELLTPFQDPQTYDVDNPYKLHRKKLLERKVLVILDDVSEREQIDDLLRRGEPNWISKGSRIIIATSDMSLTNDVVDDTYMVQNLNHRDSLQLFHSLAFDDQTNPPNEDFMKLSEEFVHYARGHPLALKVWGADLNKKSIDYWKSKLAQSSTHNIGSVFQVSYDALTPEQKSVFLDIACFRSLDVDYVESLLASSSDALKALTDKCLINTCDGRVEMHDLLYTFSRELDIDPKASNLNGSKQRRLWLYKDIIKGRDVDVLQNKMNPQNVRGIFLDLSEVKGERCLDCDHFINMRNLRYLKFYNSHCPQECETKNKINIPDELKLPLKEVRCLHWLKFPSEELPNDFDPSNLVDLKLPNSGIERLWKGKKATPVLKWVDLNHSSKLCSLSGLSKATNLQRLNLEGCTALEELPHCMKRMKMLAFLNLKGCTSLKSLPEMSLVSLKILTLSNCANFQEFPLISENIETLYLDGTAISQLPTNMKKLKKLVVLNMKNCKMLEEIPDRVGELKALQELILSDCVNLKVFPEVNMSSLNILLLDGTAIEVMPQLPSLHYLCLSRNNKISCLPAGISQLSQLKWLDLRYCRSLTSVPEFPPNIQCLNAHGCSSLKTVSERLARIMPTEQNHSKFIFTNCENLDQAAKDEITSYAQRKCQMLAYARKRYNGGLVSEALFSTCFPGCEVPSWFCHEAVGSLLQPRLLPHWHDKRLAGIALCAVVSFINCQDQISPLSVACTFKVKVEDKSWVSFTCPVGSWIREGDGKDKIESEHVFIGYTSCPYTIKCPEDEHSDKCNSTEASLEFSVTGGTGENGKFKVLKCGLGLVYAKDKSKNSSHEAKYDMPVEVSIQETLKGVNGGANKRKKKRGDDEGQPKKKKKSMKGNDIQSQSNCNGSVTPNMKM